MVLGLATNFTLHGCLSHLNSWNICNYFLDKFFRLKINLLIKTAGYPTAHCRQMNFRLGIIKTLPGIWKQLRFFVVWNNIKFVPSFLSQQFSWLMQQFKLTRAKIMGIPSLTPINMVNPGALSNTVDPCRVLT